MTDTEAIRKLIETLESIGPDPLTEGPFDWFKRNKQAEQPAVQARQPQPETSDPLIAHWKSLASTLNNALQSLKSGKLFSAFHGQEMQKMPKILERALSLGQQVITAKQRKENAAFVNLGRQLGATLSELATMRQQGFNQYDGKTDPQVAVEARQFAAALTNVLKQVKPFFTALRTDIEAVRKAA
jgi:hypothetical protein